MTSALGAQTMAVLTFRILRGMQNADSGIWRRLLDDQLAPKVASSNGKAMENDVMMEIK